MIANLFEIKEAVRYEKGLFAKQFIPKGTVVYFHCKNCGTYSKEELSRLTKKELDFVMNHEIETEEGLMSKSCDKRLFYINHSCNANILKSAKGFGIVVRDIKNGEEATEDYRIYDETLHFVGGCKCGEKGCMKDTTYKRPASKRLQKFWDKKLNIALKLIPYIKQPLKSKLLKEHPELSYLFDNLQKDKASNRMTLNYKDIDIVLNNYDIGGFKNFKKIRSGHQSDNYLITTSKGKFVVKVFYESEVDSNSLSDILFVHEYLAKHGIKTTRPLRTKLGNLYTEYKDRTIALQTFLEGESHTHRPTKHLFSLYGEELGKADYVLRSLKLKSLTKFEGGPMKFISKIESKHPLTDKYLGSQFALLKEEFNNIPVKDLTISVIHGDSGPGNFIVKDNKITGIIDFGAVRIDYMLAEIAFFLARADLYTMKDKSNYLTFIKSYIESSHINKYELLWLHTFVKVAVFCDLLFANMAGNKKKVDGHKKAIRQLESNPNIYLEIFKSKNLKFYIAESNYGIGTFASRLIKKGEKIMIFKGPLITHEQTKTPEHKDHFFQIGVNSYQGKMPTRRRPVNHSCNPNAGIIGRMTLVAIHNIKKDEEITFDYSTTMYNDNSRMKCSCGSKNCRRIIREFRYLPERTKQEYIKFGIVPKWLIKALAL